MCVCVHLCVCVLYFYSLALNCHFGERILQCDVNWYGYMIDCYVVIVVVHVLYDLSALCLYALRAL